MPRSQKLAVSSVDPVHLVPRRIVTRTPRMRAVVDASPAPLDGGKGDAYVGLDPSLTGYGVIVYFGDGQHVEKLITTKADEDVYAYRLKNIKDELVLSLCAITEHFTVKAICVERPAYNASGAFTGGLVHAATALALLEVFGGTTLVKPDLVASTTLKKFITGKGTGPKSVIIKGVYKKWGYDTDDENLADAYGLARLAAAIASDASELLTYERDCVTTVLKRRTPWQPPQEQRPKSGSPRSSTRSKDPATPSKSAAPRRRSSA